MPYYNNEQDQNASQMDILNPQAQQQTSEDPSVSTGGQAGTTSLPSETQQASNKPKKSVGSGSYTPFKKYLEANRGQSQNLASAVTKKTTQRQENINKQVNKQQTDYARRVAEQRARLSQAQSQAQSQIDKATQVTELPQDVTSGVENTQQFLTGDDIYNAPDQLDIGKQEYDARKLALQSQQSQTESGRRALLAETFQQGPDRYTRGQSTLDQFILQGSPEARRSVVQKTQEAARSATDAIKQARQQAAMQFADQSQQESTVRQNLLDQISQEQGEIGSTLEARRNALTDLSRRLKEGTVGGFGQELLSEAGLEGGRTYGVDVGSYLTGKEANIGEVAKTEELARARALAQLTGQQQDIISDIGLVGSNTDVTGVKGLQEAINEAKQRYESEVNPVKQELIGAQTVSENLNLARAKQKRIWELNALANQITRPLAGYDTESNKPKELNEQEQAQYDDIKGQIDNLTNEITNHQNIVEQWNPNKYAALRGQTYSGSFGGMYNAMLGAASEYEARKKALEEIEQRFGGKLL